MLSLIGSLVTVCFVLGIVFASGGALGIVILQWVEAQTDEREIDEAGPFGYGGA